MIECHTSDLCRAVHGTLLQSGSESFTGMSTDSRHIENGNLFIPLVGERFDGHTYLDQALRDGASGCFTQQAPSKMIDGKFYILVDNTLTALQDMAEWYRGLFPVPVVQITGSAGKTTTKEMTAAVLSQHGPVLKTEANYNNDIGVPQTLARLAPEHWAAVIETGIDCPGQLRTLGKMVRPQIAVITNIGDAHIENMGNTRLGTLKSKCEIFENLDPNGFAVLNGDDELLNTVHPSVQTIRFGRGENCDVRVTDIRDRGIEGIDCTVTSAKAVYRLSIPSPGVYMIYSAAVAVAIGEKLGLTEAEIVAGVANYHSTGSRMRRLYLRDDRLVIDDCYNANPQAMAGALSVLAGSHGKQLAVLGDMGELGAVSERAHREVGRLCAELGIDHVVAVGPKSAAIAETAGSRCIHFDTIEDAMPAIHRLLTEGTTALVKASHAMGFEKIVNELEETYS